MKRLILTFGAAVLLIFGFSVFASAQARPRSGGGSGGGGGTHATAPAQGGSGQAAPRSGGSSQAAPRSGGPSGQAARPRGESGGSPRIATGRPVARGPFYGTAAPRSLGSYGRIYLPNHYYVSPYYYSPYAFGAFGLGFWAYNPFWWGGWWGSPYWGWGSPYWGYPGYGWGYNYGYYDYGQNQGGDYGENQGGATYEQQGTGSLKLKVKPKEAEVYVDGYYMGQVDDFNGSFQHLDLEAGAHKIEIRAEGYQPLVVQMRIEPGRTVTYENEMRRLQ